MFLISCFRLMLRQGRHFFNQKKQGYCLHIPFYSLAIHNQEHHIQGYTPAVFGNGTYIQGYGFHIYRYSPRISGYGLHILRYYLHHFGYCSHIFGYYLHIEYVNPAPVPARLYRVI